MTSNVKVSIVVPVYNVESYLSRCIDSLLNQSMKEIQIILVDDGSEDNSGAICDKYACCHENIEVIHQSNHGSASSSRRIGLDACVGEYVIFVDSDDWIAENTCQKEYDYISQSKAKLLICDFNIVDGKNVTRSQGFRGKKMTISEFYESVTPGFICNKMYHRSLLDMLKIDINVSQAEDMAMLLPLVSRLNSDSDIIYIPEAFYNYCKRKGSTSDNSTFIENYSIDEYLASLKYIIKNSNKARMKEVSFYCMNCLSWGFNSVERKYFKADYCEFFANELYKYILGNSLITEKFPQLLIELVGQSSKLIPRNLVYGNFENDDSELFRYCKNSWVKRCRNYNIVEVDITNCNIQEAPNCVKEAIIEKNFEFVNDYFCLEYLVKNGGIAISKDLFLYKPLGEIRYNGVFFSYINEKDIGKAIYGMEKSNSFGMTILETYKEQHIFNDAFLPLNKRFQFELEGNWGLVPKGITCKLMDGAIHLYAKNIMTEMSDDNCLAEVVTDEQYQAHKSGMVLIDRNSFFKIITDRKDKAAKATNSNNNEISMGNEKYLQQEEKLINERNMYKQAYENTISSTSWKITLPLRNIMDRLKRRKV